MDKGGTVRPEFQNTADDLYHLRGATHRPVQQRDQVIKERKHTHTHQTAGVYVNGVTTNYH